MTVTEAKDEEAASKSVGEVCCGEQVMEVVTERDIDRIVEAVQYWRWFGWPTTAANDLDEKSMALPPSVLKRGGERVDAQRGVCGGGAGRVWGLGA